MASSAKKPRSEGVEEQSTDLKSLPKKLIRELAQALDGLCFHTSKSEVTLRPLKILNSNAADGRFGIPFSKAYCCLEDTNKLYMFGDVFRRGLDIVTDFLVHGKLPDAKYEQFVFTRLLRFLTLLPEKQDAFQNLEELSETAPTTVLANHFFGEIATSSNYIIDRNCIGKRKDNCFCGIPNCTLTGSYGDTSIGNEEVWHGSLDIIVNDVLGIRLLKEKQDSLGGKSPEEKKLTTESLSKNAQIIAETIVFSFLQMQRHPEIEHFMTPCIGICNSEIIVVFYDPESDVLLESSLIPLFASSPVEGMPKKLNITAVLVAWLVANYKYLCSGITQDIENSLKAGFDAQAKKKLEVYKTKLKFQNVSMQPIYMYENKRDLDVVYPSEFTFEKHIKLGEVIFQTSLTEASEDGD